MARPSATASSEPRQRERCGHLAGGECERSTHALASLPTCIVVFTLTMTGCRNEGGTQELDPPDRDTAVVDTRDESSGDVVPDDTVDTASDADAVCTEADATRDVTGGACTMDVDDGAVDSTPIDAVDSTSVDTADSVPSDTADGDDSDDGETDGEHTASCVAQGDSCVRDADCCDGVCGPNRTCEACLADGATCSAGELCCSGVPCDPVAGGCAACMDEFGPCTFDYECCDGWCHETMGCCELCECQPMGEGCTVHDDCCPGLFCIEVRCQIL